MLSTVVLAVLLVLGLSHFALAQTLADGRSFQTGILNASVRWQSSGVLQVGNCQVNVPFSPCYRMALAATGNLEETGRQRIEFLSWPPSVAGETWVFDWSYYLSPNVSYSGHWFHLSQLLSRETGGYIVSLDLFKDTVRIFDTVRTLLTSVLSPSCGGTCPSVPATSFWGRTTYHRMTVTFGAQGSLRYTVRAPASAGGSQTTLISYTVPTGSNIPAESTIKTGLYRLVLDGQTAATAFAGAFSFRKTA
ncbi:hypothetical protein BCR35DRAFT_345537 [Leucosporidium creatinivorum]|uniref:Concanavalin A-like lectin/glucanase domain-containing protein n=1 Tax=Leucosporidium creatinivorum TaxID=106004 RepID=A0A1Y2EET6_9BASI|nr:hypothetical protein BCR35DRAFT_345537 [Leucosporidium creatinivorum]